MDTDANDVEIKLNDQNIVAKTWSLTNSARGSQQCEAKSGLLVRPRHEAQLRFWAKEKWNGLKQKTLKELTTGSKQRPPKQFKVIKYGKKISLCKSWKLVGVVFGSYDACQENTVETPRYQDASVCRLLKHFFHLRQRLTSGILATYMTRERCR